MEESDPATLTVNATASMSLTPNSETAGYAGNPAIAVTGTNTQFVSGTTTLKITNSGGADVIGGATLSVTDSTHASFDLPTGLTADTYTVTLTTNSEVVTATLTVNSSGGGGGTPSTPSPVISTTGSTDVSPSAGGTVSMGTSASVSIPAGALQGSNNATVAVQAASSSPAAPSGFMIQGQVYQFTVNGQDHYTFNSDVTLTFTFDPSKITSGETPSVYYFDY